VQGFGLATTRKGNKSVCIRKELAPMKKWTSLFLIATLISLFLLGCTGTSKDIKIRCPKCGSYFDTKEGKETFEWMRGR
jgi:hypothetical protein